MKNSIINLFLHVALLLVFSVSKAQTTNDTWSLKVGGTLVDHGKAIATDAEGNVYVTGGFQSKSNFGGKESMAYGDTDIFIAKYDKSGKPIWSTQAGSSAFLTNTLSEYGSDILVDNSAVYVTGIFLSSAQFQGQEVKAQGRDDIFLAKYSLDGKLEWVKSAGGESQDVPYSLSSDKYGNIYLTGSFQKTALFDDEKISALNSTDMFLAKYNPQGELLWVRQSFSKQSSLGKAVRCSGEYCVVAGEFEGLLIIGENRLTATNQNVFIAKFNLEGDVLSTKHLKGTSEITVRDLMIDENQIYLTGAFRNGIDFNEKQLFSKGNFDTYLAKLDDKSNLISMNSFGGSFLDEASKIINLNNNEVLLAGNFQGDMHVNGVDFKAKGAGDFFLFYFSKDGYFKRGEIFGGVGHDQLTGAVYKDSHLYTTGFFRDSLVLNNQVLASSGLSDVMINKINILPGLAEKIVSEPTIYPNPTRDHFFVKSETPIISIKVFNLIGKVIFEKSDINANTYKVGIEGFVPGLYIVKIIREDGFFESKLILEK
jgi:outer membrane protein assembly factor BamB